MIRDREGSQKAPHVFFATPSYSGNFSKPYLQSLEATETLLHENGWNASLAVIKGDCYVQRARNALVSQFMESGATDLFFLDDDMGWPSDAALKLLEMPDPFVFGAYPFKREVEGYPVVINTDRLGYPIVREDGCISSMGAPTGFIRIKREVIEKLQAANPHRIYDEHDDFGEFSHKAYDLFPQGAVNGRWWGEDIAFCNLWTSIGGEIWCVPDIDFVHVAQDHTYTGNYHNFLMRQPRASEAA